MHHLRFVIQQVVMVWLVLAAIVPAAMAAENLYEFDNEADRERFQQFTRELRCPKCQSQSLAGSNSLISRDLKRELHRLIVEGKSDEEIREFMVSRYGDFVLYKPKVQENTYLLWFGPLILLVIGLVVAGWIIFNNQSNKSQE